ncbi:MAG: hypothetical protein JWO36_2756 [Myxococcales bacterium]|nr:hypothetical protein [Myxococcales bacterium]
MKLLRLVPIVLALGTGVALAQPPTKSPPAPATPGEEMAAADVQRWLAFFDKLVDAVVAGEKDCDKMATEVGHVIDRNKPALDMARNARNSRKKLPLAAQQHMMDGVKKMAPGIQNCGEKDNVRAAFARLDVSHDAAK